MLLFQSNCGAPAFCSMPLHPHMRDPSAMGCGASGASGLRGNCFRPTALSLSNHTCLHASTELFLRIPAPSTCKMHPIEASEEDRKKRVKL